MKEMIQGVIIVALVGWLGTVIIGFLTGLFS